MWWYCGNWPGSAVCLFFSQPAIEIYSLHVDCKVTSRFAHTVITSRIVNRANESREATFEVELPKTAFITNFSMSIDGEVYPGIIKEKAAAQNEYDTAVSQGQSAGLVKITDRKLEQFHVSVSIAAASKVTFELTYEELLKRQLGKYELLIKVRPQQLVKHFQIDVHIFEPQGIQFLETDSTFMTNELSEALTKEVNETKARISFKPTLDQQKKNSELDETLLNGDFVVRYDVKREATAGDIQIVNGYFVHYFAPQEMPVFPKNVVFVIDRSGSMTGRKIEQTRDALLKILQDLRPEDHFNFITFNNKVAEWKSSLLPATEENVASAATLVQTLTARGGTDINGALLSAVGVLEKAEGLLEPRISMIILLTDGQPTSAKQLKGKNLSCSHNIAAGSDSFCLEMLMEKLSIRGHQQLFKWGERNVEVIQENVQTAINGKYALFCLGFGFDVSYKFLEKMALSNGGIARRIYENADAALQLQGFYQEVATPILMQIEMQYPENSIEGLTKNNFKLFFEGSEIIVSGKISDELDLLPVEIKAQSHTSNLTLKEEANVKEKEQVFQNQRYIFGNFIERLWAYLSIQQLLEKAHNQYVREPEDDLFIVPTHFCFIINTDFSISAQEEDQKALEVQALNLSLQYSFVTPLTSMVVTKPQQKEELANKPTEADNEKPESPQVQASFKRSLSRMPSEDDLGSRRGKSGSPAGRRRSDLQTGSNRMMFASYRAYEHPQLLLHLPRQNERICLNIDKRAQTSVHLVSDPEQGLTVTGKLGDGINHFVQFDINYENPPVQVHVYTHAILVSHNNKNDWLSWTKSASSTIQGLRVSVEKEKSVTASLPGTVTVKISLIKFPDDFLGLYFLNTDRFSDQVTGVLGQFYSKAQFESNSNNDQRAVERLLRVSGSEHKVSRLYKKDYRLESASEPVSCWSIDLTP
ncbi:hypothetical protein Nmel_012553 [Mimus melanotis]